MKTVILKNHVFFIGQVKDLRSLIEGLSKSYYTIAELIQAGLH